MGQFDRAVQNLCNAKANTETLKDLEGQVKTNILSIEILNRLGLTVVAQQYFLQTKAITEAVSNENISAYVNGGKNLISAQKYFDENDNKKAFANLELAQKSFLKIQNPSLINQTSASLIETYISAKGLDSAEAFFQNERNSYGR